MIDLTKIIRGLDALQYRIWLSFRIEEKSTLKGDINKTWNTIYRARDTLHTHNKTKIK